MSNRLDQLFKDKLADHAIPPSAEAWGRVKGSLSKKNRVPFVLRLAAAILLLCAAAATTVWWSRVNSSDQQPTMSKDNAAKPEAPRKEMQNVQPSNSQQATSSPRNTAKPAPGPKAVKQNFPNPVAENDQEPLRVETLPEVQLLTPIAVTSAAPEKPIVLEYRLESIQTPTVASAPESKEKSGLKKVIDFAMEAKHSDGPAGLRQAKDELFALNFIKDKQKNHK